MKTILTTATLTAATLALLLGAAAAHADPVGAGKDAANATGHRVAQTGRATGHEAAVVTRDTGHAVAETGRDTGHVVAETGRKTGHAVADTGRDASAGIRHAVHRRRHPVAPAAGPTP